MAANHDQVKARFAAGLTAVRMQSLLAPGGDTRRTVQRRASEVCRAAARSPTVRVTDGAPVESSATQSFSLGW